MRQGFLSGFAWWASAALALPLFIAPAPAQAQNVLPFDQARAAARDDRNREAAELFAKALQAEPSLRHLILRELADQLTFSDRAAQAVPFYREVLSWNEISEDERWRAKRGLALALAWSGQHAAAVKAYTELLERDRNDRDARLNRARVQGWRHHYAEAEADFRLLLAKDSKDADALRGLSEVQSLAGHQREAIKTLEPIASSGADARTLFLLSRAQQWSGRADLAGPTLARSIALAPSNRDALSLQTEIRLSRRPSAQAGGRYSDQSDHTQIRGFTAIQDFYPSSILETAGFQYDLERYSSSKGPNVTVQRAGVHGQLELSKSFSIRGEGGLAIQHAAGNHDEYPIFNVYGTLIPSDFLRFDFGAARQGFDNVRSMFLHIRSTDYGASVDIGSDSDWKASFRTNYSRVSDGNSRIWGQIEVRRRLGWSPNSFAGIRATRFSFDELLDHGYFNPKSLRSVEAFTQVWGKLGNGWFDLHGAVGAEDQNPGKTRLVYSAEAKVTHPLGNGLEIEGFVNSFTAHHDATGGFSRKTVGLALRRRW